ncbi:MAG TPA: hypothetical protein VKB34_22345 [Povalibacter sp.]|nr:hypothetical protein [Povalibacter sp.]
MNMARHFMGLLLLASTAALAADPAPQAAPPSQRDANAAPASQPPAASSQSATRAPQPASASRQKPATAAPAGRKTSDRLDLDTTVVTGNRELPKVLYIVPWKKADIGELPAQPFNTLLDEALTPVDRDVFRREVTYYGAVSSGADRPNPASATPAASPEK